jgi:diguanylate cyclase (GGDEF)-like protein/PAS domain S-box-containing protein
MNKKPFEQRPLLGSLLSDAGIAYIETDIHLNIVSWSNGAGTVFGIPETTAMGSPLDRLIPVKRQKILQGRETGMAFISQTSAQGQKIQCELYYAPGPVLSTGEPGFTILAKDISRRLKDRVSLKLQKRYIEEIYGFAPIGIFHVKINGRITMANAEFAWMLGYESSRAVIRQVKDFSSQVFFDPDRAREFMFSIFEAEQVTRFKCRLKRKDNTFIWALCYAKITRNKAGRMEGFNGFSIDIGETVRAEEALKAANEKLKYLSVMDGLTGIPNRRKFDEYLLREWKRHLREKTPLSLILSDIDHFKYYNDTYGHQAGDECLQKVAETIQACAKRSIDLAARYGGEEFAVILPGTDAAGAKKIAELIRINVQNLAMKHENSPTAPHVTLSLGVATLMPESDQDVTALIGLADKTLYEAKEQGRNQSVGRSLG